MFDHDELADVLKLHEKAFGLLRWIRACLKRDVLSFDVIHDSTDTAHAAAEWIERHFNNIPYDVRPREGQLETFARLFVSFLVTSYRLNRDALTYISPCGCRCTYCSYLRAGPNLDPRVPSKKDYRTALELKRIYLEKLAAELPECAREAANRLLNDRRFAREISMASWGHELLRRSKFTSQGEAVLALWREFAWKEHAPIKDFALSSEQLIAAEQAIVAALRANAGHS